MIHSNPAKQVPFYSLFMNVLFHYETGGGGG